MTEAGLGPWLLAPNRVSRFYSGGALLDRFRGGNGPGIDGDRPEDWLASVTPAWTPAGVPPGTEGLSRVDSDDDQATIRDLLDRAPETIGGPTLVARAGATTGILVKLLDAAVRLPVHAHPSRDFARRHLGSFFGKAEAWVVLETRHLPGQAPASLRLGFRREIERDELRQVAERGDGDSLLGLLHERPARPGDVWFIPPGLPHAIGAGVFIAEVQEPSDFSIVLERPDRGSDGSLGLGWEVTVDAIDRRAWTDADIDRLATKLQPAIEEPGLTRTGLLGPSAEPYFRAQRLLVSAPARPWTEEVFLVGIVIAGEGEARIGDRRIGLRRGTTFAVPAAGLPLLELAPAGNEAVELIGCLPPQPAALDGPGGVR
jgi:mannose-6-phosphate isomerase